MKPIHRGIGSPWIYMVAGVLALGLAISLASASRASAEVRDFCWGVKLPRTNPGSVESTCDSLYHDGYAGYLDLVGGSGKYHSVCVLAWWEGTTMCSGGPNEGVYNYSPEGKIQAPAEIDNHAWGENTVFGFVGDCSSPCGGSGEESGGGSEPPVPPQEPQPEVAVYRYMLGTSAGESIASWGTMLTGMSEAKAMSLGDMTGDGKSDIVSVEPEGTGSYRYMLGVSGGGGVSNWKQLLGNMSEAKAMSLGDMTGDGKSDIVSVEPEGTGSYRYMLGTSAGENIASWSKILGGMSVPIRLGVGDFTGDGKADILALESEGNGQYRYMLGTSNGGGVSSWKKILGGMSEAKLMSVGDFTGDGKADILALESEGNGKYRYMLGVSSGAGISSWKQVLGGMSEAKAMSVRDMTGDGKADIISVEPEGNGHYRYMLGRSSGGGVATWKQVLGGMSEPKAMSAGDFTGDGKADIVSVEKEE